LKNNYCTNNIYLCNSIYCNIFILFFKKNNFLVYILLSEKNMLLPAPRHLQNPSIAFYGLAQPKRESRQHQNQFLSFKQKFYGSVVLPVQAQSNTRSSPAQLGLNIINRAQQIQVPSVTSQPEGPINSFILNKDYKNPNKVSLFGQKNPNLEQHVFEGEIFLHLDPTIPVNNTQYKLIQHAIGDEIIELDLKALLDVFLGKIFNNSHYHLIKFVTGFLAINFGNYPAITGGEKRIFAWPVKNLRNEIEHIKKLYAFQYLGLALHMLINDKPTEITERNYNVQNYLREQGLVYGDEPNSNNYSYSLVYERPINLLVRGVSHSFVVRAAFHVFRYKAKDGSIKTKLNLNSFYPLGPNNKLKCKLWANDMHSTTALMPNSPEKQKFDDLVKQLSGCQLSSVLHEIFPGLDGNPERLVEIHTQLGITSLDSTNLTNWPIR
jgi:hypothetical protein